MKSVYTGLVWMLGPGLAGLAGQTVIPASFDSTLDFWSGVVNADWSTMKQGYASNAAMAPQAGDALYRREFDEIGMLVRFDLSGVSAATVNAAGFQALLDVMFHGFTADFNRYAEANPDPSPTPGAGDGFIYLDVYRMADSYANSANRWMKNSTSGTLRNWDNTVPTSLALATAAGSNFNDAGSQLPLEAEDQTVFVMGWNLAEPPPGATVPNEYGELVWDVTRLVRDWVNGVTPNNGLFIHVNKQKSWGEQVNLLTMEEDNRPPTVTKAGDAAPLLRMGIVPDVPVVAGVLSDPDFVVESSSQAGYYYQLQFSADLVNWVDVAASQAGTGGMLQFVRAAPADPGSEVFYRVKASLAP